MSILLWVLVPFLLGLGLILTIAIKVFGTNEMKVPSTNLNLGGKINSIWIKCSLGLMAVIILYFYILEDPIAAWLPTSKGGQALGLTNGMVEDWLWLVVVLMFSVFALWLALRTPATSTGTKTVPLTPKKDSLMGVILVTLFIIAGSVIGFGLVYKGELGNVFAGDKLSPNGCQSLEVFAKHDYIVHEDKKCFFISTKDESVEVMFSPFSTKYRLEFTFVNADSTVLKGREVSSLLNIAPVQGAISTYRKVSPNVRALSASGLGMVEVMVYAVPL